MIREEEQSGFVALITAIVLSLILIVVTTTLNQTSFFARSVLLDSEYKERSAALAEACIDIARLKLVDDATYVGSEAYIPIGSSSCEIRPLINDSPSIGQKTIETRGIFLGATTNLKVVVKSDDISVVSWSELESF